MFVHCTCFKINNTMLSLTQRVCDRTLCALWQAICQLLLFFHHYLWFLSFKFRHKRKKIPMHEVIWFTSHLAWSNHYLTFDINSNLTKDSNFKHICYSKIKYAENETQSKPHVRDFDFIYYFNFLLQMSLKLEEKHWMSTPKYRI